MSKRIISFLLIAVLVLISALITGCSGSKEESAPKGSDSIDIMISIDYPAKAEIPDMENIKFKVEKNSSVLDAIQLYCSVSEISCLVDTSFNSLEGIGGVQNGDYDKYATWHCMVNDALIAGDPSNHKLANGDSLSLIYE